MSRRNLLAILAVLVATQTFHTAVVAGGASDSSWKEIFQGGLNGQVRAILVSGSDLFVGGEFTTAGGTVVNRIAKWDGSSWSALGVGMNGPVTALVIQGGTLYAGGSFTVAGGQQAKNVAKWDGSAWSAVGSGTDGPVYALAVWNNALFAGGDFNLAGSVPVNNIAKWNGTSWAGLATGLDCSVYALASDDWYLYVGGGFTLAGNIEANRVARWNGEGWESLSIGMDGPVTCLAVRGNVVEGGLLFAGGTFSEAGGVVAANLARWNGTYWWPVGQGVGRPVRTVATTDSILYAGGWFTTAGGTAATFIASSSGSGWTDLAGGTDAPVSALATRGQALFVGGEFETAGGIPAGRIALWDPESSVDQVSLTKIKSKVTIASGSSMRDLWFGVRAAAARGIWGVDPAAGAVDSSEGEEELPPVVNGTFDARFMFPAGDYPLFGGGSWIDMRNFLTSAQADSYRIAFDPGPSGYPVRISWSSVWIQQSYLGDVSITPVGGATYDMKTTDSIIVADDHVDQLIIAASGPNLPVLFGPGWNLISIPNDVPNGSKSILYPDVPTSAYSYSSSGGYQPSSLLQPGLGYWLKFTKVVHVLSFDGLPITSDTIFVQPGWNLIGSLSVPIPVTNVTSVPPGMVTGNFFGYNGGFSTVDDLEPMRGYWVKTNTYGMMILSADIYSNTPSAAGAIRVVPDGELPPVPPGDAVWRDPPVVSDYALMEVYPNPFNPLAHIEFTLPEESRVDILVYNVYGQIVARLGGHDEPEGRGVITWDASDLASGVYFCRLEAASVVDPSRRYAGSRKMVLMK